MSTPPKASTAAAKALGDRLLGGDVAADRRAAVAQLRDRVGGAVAVEVEGHHRRARRRSARATTARPIPPAAPVTSATLPWSSPGGGASESL